MKGATSRTAASRQPDGRVLACGVLVCALLASFSQAQEYAKARYEGAEQLVPELEKLALWCGSVGLNRERDRTYANILELKSDHETARRALLYQRQPDASWLQSPNYKEPKDASDKQIPAYREKCATIARPFIARVFEVIEKEKATTPPATHEGRLRELLRFDPDHAGVRAALGEAKRDADWVLAETVAGAKRRADLEKMAKACVDAPVTLDPAETTPFESAVPVPWSWKKKTSRLRLIGTVPEKEADKTLRLCDAAVRFTLQALKVEGGPFPDFTIIAFAKPEQGVAFLTASPDVHEEDRKSIAVFHSYMLKTGHFITYDPIGAERMREAVCRTIGSTLSMTVQLYEPSGGALEGSIVYLTRRVTGVCKPFFGQPSAGEEDLEDAMANPKADWIKGAARLTDAGKAFAIKDFLARDAYHLTLHDTLFAYAFMAFLVEACPEQAPKFLRLMGRQNPDEAAKEVFGVDIAILEPRFHRWLHEYR